MITFIDTCYLLNNLDKINDHFYISSVTIEELENIKTSIHKDEDIKYKARKVVRFLTDNRSNYTVIPFKYSYEELNELFDDLPRNNDSQILACAYSVYLEAQKDNTDFIFITNDLLCQHFAELLGIPVSFDENNQKEEYTGYKEIELNEEDLAHFYNDIYNDNYINHFNLLENEYVIIKQDGNIVDKYKWKNGKYIRIGYKKIPSRFFGDISPMNGDAYQQLAIDSLLNNQITVLRGKAGSGKSYLGLGSLISLFEAGKINKIIIFCNTVAVRGAAKLGFYPGDKDEKLLDSQIGNFLAAKFGGMDQVEIMIEQGTLVLVPAADCRGMDTTGMQAGIYITEAQNSTIDMMKLMLQRVGEDAVCVVEGDDKSQVDMVSYSGDNNGLSRLSEVFRGKPFYGEVTLQTCYRSKIAATAELM